MLSLKAEWSREQGVNLERFLKLEFLENMGETMGEQIRIKRRISKHPMELGITRMLKFICPDIFETESGDFVIIGRDVHQILRLSSLQML